jgi:hypothetical protein
VPASKIGLLKQKHAEELKGLQTQAARALELETELAKVQEAESKLRLGFDQRLTKEKEILVAKYDAEVDELRTSQGVEIKNRDAKIRELVTLWGLDDEKHEAEFSVWHARDRKLHAGLQGLEHALRGAFPSLLLRFRSFMPLPLLFAVLAEAFPDSDKAAAAAVEEYRVEHHIICSKDSKAKLSSEELMALTKERLQPVAKLGSELHDVVASMFQALWPGQAVPNNVETLLRWVPLVSNRVDVWKESAARAGAEQALSFVLSWYQGVNLDQLKHLREGGLVGLDEAKLH